MVKRGKHNYCPVCGVKLEHVDNFCYKCGYSFSKRVNKKKKIKWKNLALLVIIILVVYGSIKHFNGESILSFFKPN